MNDNTDQDIPVRLPAEWERTGAVLIAWPHKDTDWEYMLPEIQECYIKMCEAITRYTSILIATPHPEDVIPQIIMSDIPPERIQWATVPTNDTWTRDYGPIVTTSGPDDWYINDFKFNGWGLKFAADKDNLVNSRMMTDGVYIGHYRNRLGFVLEGGSIESDGRGTLMTTSRCLMSPNRNGNMSRQEIEEYLCSSLGAERILWVDHGSLEGDDTDSHIDTLARFAPDDTILYVATDNTDDSHYESLKEMENDLKRFRTSSGQPYKLLKLPLPSPIFDADSQRLPATYANFLIVNNAVVAPVYGDPVNDDLALDVLRQAFPDHDIVPVNCKAMIAQHGSLHCSTMQLPYEILPLCPTPFI